MEILCTLKNIHLTYGLKNIFNGASITIHDQSKIGLLGLNGHGKSSLLKIINGTVLPDPSTPPFQFDKAKSSDRAAFDCFYVPQDPLLKDDSGKPIEDNLREYFFRYYPKLRAVHLEIEKLNQVIEKSFGDELEKVIEKQKTLLNTFEELSGWELLSNYESYLKYFGLFDFEKKFKELSGGEQKKVLLSLGFSSPATLILWDEPTNHLDIDTIRKFEERLMAFQKAFILITHDRHLLGATTNQIFHVENGEIVSFTGSYLDYLTHLKQKEEANQKLIAKLKNTLTRETEWMRQGIKARGTRSKKRVENYQDIKNKISSMKEKARKELELNIQSSQRKSKLLIDAKDISHELGGKKLFNHLDLEIFKGNKIGLVGTNGSGKTTLTKILTNKITPDSGNIKLADQLSICHFTQNRDELKDELTAFEFLGDGNDHVILADGRQRHIAAYFESFLFSKNQLHRPLKTFSGGEKNRLQLAKNLLKAADLWIFDEPTNDLDLETLHILEETLTSFEGSIILISHDRSFLANVTNKVWYLHNGELESFEAGYEQAEAYIDASIIQDSYQEEDPQEEETPASQSSESFFTPQKSEKKKLTYMEKKRLKELPQLIEKAELSVEEIEEELANVDYSSAKQETIDKVGQLDQQKQELEEELLNMYEELDSLSS